MINKIDIWRNYHNQAITITLSNMNESLSGRIVDDSQDDHCVFVKDHDLVKYYETKEEALLRKVYFSDLEHIEFQ